MEQLGLLCEHPGSVYFDKQMERKKKHARFTSKIRQESDFIYVYVTENGKVQ